MFKNITVCYIFKHALNYFMEVTCLEDAAFYALIDKVVERIKEQNNIREDKWISGKEAMHKLRISRKTTLQKLRDAGNIHFTQPGSNTPLFSSLRCSNPLRSGCVYLREHGKAWLAPVLLSGKHQYLAGSRRIC